MNKEIRSYGTELRVIPTDKGKPSILEGYAAVFNSRSVDMGGWFEVIDAHAFDKTLKENPDVLALYSHDSALVIGRTVSSTLDLSVDSKGLKFTCSLPDTSTGNDLAVLVNRGDIRGNSFGFICTHDDWNEDKDGTIVRTLLEVELIEITVTAMPAYPETSVALRSMPADLKIKAHGVPCTCPCSQCQASACNICSTKGCEYVGCTCPEQNSKTLTKEVDGEHLTQDCFLIVGNPKDTSTWKLPYKFSSDEKTKDHLRNALARFDQLKDVPDDQKQSAHTKLIDLCKQYGIDVSSEDDTRAWKETLELRIRLANLRFNSK